MSLHPALQLVFWHWWLVGLALMIVEAFLPGAFFLWMGISALVVGTLLWAAPGLGIVFQVALFAAVAIGSVLAWRRLRPQKNAQVAVNGLNDRSSLYTGRTFTLEAPIVNGIGRVRVDDGQWRVAGPDLPAGSCVRVIAVEGATLRVEKAD